MFVPHRPTHECLYASEDSLSFGRKDLVLNEDFSSCTSELEQCYGIGLPPNTRDAAEFLAGSSSFVAEELEIWAMF